jgi:hypothetical protein
MSLLTRMVLLLSLVVLSVAMAAGLFIQNDNSPSGIDRFVSARNVKEAVAYQTVRTSGGIVPASAGLTTVEAGAVYEAAARPGSNVAADKSLLWRESWRAYIGLKKLELEAEKYRKGWSEGGKDVPNLDKLREDIAKNIRIHHEEAAGFAKVEDDLTNLGVTLSSYSESISRFSSFAFSLDYEVHQKLADANALRAEKMQIEVDTSRLLANKQGLEEENNRLSNAFSRAAITVATYDRRDPALRGQAGSAGKPWIRGEVTKTSADNLSGLVWFNLGSVDGIKVGQRLAVEHNGAFVAYMRVESVNANDALGRLEEGFRGTARVNSNDTVRAPSNFAAGR